MVETWLAKHVSSESVSLSVGLGVKLVLYFLINKIVSIINDKDALFYNLDGNSRNNEMNKNNTNFATTDKDYDTDAWEHIKKEILVIISDVNLSTSTDQENDESLLWRSENKNS